MIDLTTYALLRKQISSVASGISDVRAEGEELIFVLADGREVRVAIPATEIRDAVVRDDMLVLTLEDDKEVVVDATLTQSGQAADAKVTGEAVSQLKDDMTAKADKAALTRTDRSLDALWKLNQGISYDFQTDAAAAYAKQVPRGAKLASVEEIGGKTVVWNQPWQNKNYTKEQNGISITVEGKHFTAVVNNPTGYCQAEAGKIKLIIGHKYLFILDKEILRGMEFYAPGINGIRSGRYAINTPNESYLGDQSILIFVRDNTENGTYEYDAGVFDLTQLFGSGNEPTDITDSRIAWIEQYAAAHPEYNAGELVSADVESVKYNDAIVAAIPSTVRALPGYGWSAGSMYNSIERTESGWKYVQRIGSVDLGTLYWDKIKTAVDGKYRYRTTITNIKYNTKNYVNTKYTNIKSTNTATETGNALSNNNYFVYDEAYSTSNLDAFKTAMNGVMLYYELAEPIEMDITELMLDTLEPFDVEGGGTLTFTNAAQLPVPSSVEYIVSLAEVGA